ncbi:MAG: hypothetical protein Q9212_002127 [Teloschistes hypoglaucus]
MDILEELSFMISNKEIDPNAKEVDELTETSSLQLKLRDITSASYLEGACDTAEIEVGQWLTHVAPMLRLAKRRRESLPILARFPDPDSPLRKQFADSICAAFDKTIGKLEVWSDQLVQMPIAISKLRELWLRCARLKRLRTRATNNFKLDHAAFTQTPVTGKEILEAADEIDIYEDHVNNLLALLESQRQKATTLAQQPEFDSDCCRSFSQSTADSIEQVWDLRYRWWKRLGSVFAPSRACAKQTLDTLAEVLFRV